MRAADEAVIERLAASRPNIHHIQHDITISYEKKMEAISEKHHPLLPIRQGHHYLADMGRPRQHREGKRMSGRRDQD